MIHVGLDGWVVATLCIGEKQVKRVKEGVKITRNLDDGNDGPLFLTFLLAFTFAQIFPFLFYLLIIRSKQANVRFIAFTGMTKFVPKETSKVTSHRVSLRAPSLRWIVH